MTGLYLVAAELSKRKLIVSPTSRSAQTADLLVTDANCQRAYAVQVKTNASIFSFWLMNSKTKTIKSDFLVYAFVNLRKNGTEFYLVPSCVVADNVKSSDNSTWWAIELKDIADFKDNWGLFE